MSADRFKQAAQANDSGSWNKYSYTRGDPTNSLDPSGMDDCPADFCATGTGYGDDPYGGFGGAGGPQRGKPGNQGNDPKTNRASAKYAGFDVAVGKLSGDCAKDVVGVSGSSTTQAQAKLQNSAINEVDLGGAAITPVPSSDGTTTGYAITFLVAFNQRQRDLYKQQLLL